MCVSPVFSWFTTIYNSFWILLQKKKKILLSYDIWDGWVHKGGTEVQVSVDVFSVTSSNTDYGSPPIPSPTNRRNCHLGLLWRQYNPRRVEGLKQTRIWCVLTRSEFSKTLDDVLRFPYYPEFSLLDTLSDDSLVPGHPSSQSMQFLGSRQ